MNKAVVLLSGGMDSTAILHYVTKRLKVPEIYALSFIYGQKHFCELEMANWQAKSVEVTDYKKIDISSFSGLIAGSSALTDEHINVPDLVDIDKNQRTQPITYVPNRNMVFLSLAAAYAETVDAQDIFYGAQAQDEYGYWDCTGAFVNRINNVLSLNRKKTIIVHAPFVNKTKTEVLKIGLELGVDYEHTWTCYRGGSAPCGTCPSCVERAAAFHNLDKIDPLT